MAVPFSGLILSFYSAVLKKWRAQGYAKIKVLFFSLKVKFNISWGEKQKIAPVFIKPDELLEKLRSQLQQSGNWTAKIPDGFNGAVSFRSLEEAEKQDQVFIHPASFLELRQNLIPLNTTIGKMGNKTVEVKTSYRISDYTFGNGQPVEAKTQPPLQDYFSRGHFEDLTDDEKLSTPDFDLMTAGVKVAPGELFDIPANDIQSTPNDFEDII
ncbi:MAG: hypothetical protein IPF54_20055 [Draconibacterium sp.]|nr:hypothetical protein [Draconibacterium sp.]